MSEPVRDASVFASLDKGSAKATHVFFTLNNPTSALDFAELEKHDVTFLLYQKEKGEAEGTPHFQGVFSLKKQKRLSALKKLPGLEKAHFERVKHLAKAVNYCKKEETRLEGPWEFGELTGRGQGTRTDLDDIQGRLDASEPLSAIAKDNFQAFLQYGKAWRAYLELQYTRRTTEPLVLLFVGPSGTGKTRTAHAIAQYFPSYYVSPMTKGSGWYCDGYQQQHVFILDEMNGNLMTPERFNRLVDRYPDQLAYHGGQCEFNSPVIIITSNYLPKYWWKNRSAAQVSQTTRRIHGTVFFGQRSPPPSDVAFQDVTGDRSYVPFGRLLEASEPSFKKAKN